MFYHFEFCLKNMWNCSLTQQILSHSFYSCNQICFQFYLSIVHGASLLLMLGTGVQLIHIFPQDNFPTSFIYSLRTISLAHSYIPSAQFPYLIHIFSQDDFPTSFIYSLRTISVAHSYIPSAQFPYLIHIFPQDDFPTSFIYSLSTISLPHSYIPSARFP